jgi:hypothetical protein
MKQGGAFLAVILAISGVLHFTGSGGAQQTSSGDSGAAKKKTSHSHSEYIDDLRGTIQDFYGVSGKNQGEIDDLASHWNVPDAKGLTGDAATKAANPREDVHFVVAILPDPLHTRLALVFDRSIEAIQEAAERDHYAFDRAIFPWDRTPPPQPDDVDKRREAAEVQKAAETYPGLLIFRGPNPDPKSSTVDYPAPLFVFVVGETPTSGIRKKQFQHAIEIMKQIRDGKQSAKDDAPAPTSASAKSPTASAKPRPLLILGPSSSGSLRSLKRELQVLEKSSERTWTESFVYSGSITDATSMQEFIHPNDQAVHFASYQDNDDFIRDRFLRFACRDGYYPYEIATLSEGDTAYGSGVQTNKVQAPGHGTNSNSAHPDDDDNDKCSAGNLQKVVHLRFPREISYFRAAYQGKTSTPEKSDSEIPVPQPAAIALNPEEIGTDDDAALPYAGAQTPATQEAVMLGIVSELNKHHTKFTILYASDPLDQFFLARYLRTKYPRGRVVVTTPDLLLISQEDSSLRGVLGLNTYPIVPGLNDTFCYYSDQSPLSQKKPPHGHDDRLFVSSQSIGTYNAMLGLLAQSGIADASKSTPADDGQKPETSSDSETKSAVAPPTVVPPAPYAEFATPPVRTLGSGSTAAFCAPQPLVWLTMLGSDSYWPIAGLSDRDLQTDDRDVPVLKLSVENGDPTESEPSTEPNLLVKEGSKFILVPPANDAQLRLPPAWKLSYCFAVFLLFLHMYLSLNGSILADSEPRAQFARIDDWRDVAVVGLGALALETAFVTIMFSGGPVVGELGLIPSFSLWLPLSVFVILTTYDLSWFRNQWKVGAAFAASTLVMLALQASTWLGPRDFTLFWAACGSDPGYACNWIARKTALHSALWSTRLLHYTSGLSPVLPILFLAAAGYWWMWQSLRGVTLVDRRRPRLPDRAKPVARWYRINDREAMELRTIAHPVFFKWSVVIVLIIVGVFLITVLDFRHPVQSVEGEAYDWIYTILLSLMIGTLIGILLKLIFTWLKCSQILSGLDRLALRNAFSRMKHLSWHSLWSPGGSTLRATYKVLERGLDGLKRLDCVLLKPDEKTPIDANVRTAIRESIKAATDARLLVTGDYENAVAVMGNEDAKEKEKANEKANERAKEKRKTRDPLLAKMVNFFRKRAGAPDLPNNEMQPLGEANPAVPPKPKIRTLKQAKEYLCLSVANFLENRMLEGIHLPILMDGVEDLQIAMAEAAAELVDRLLFPWWECDKSPVVSEDDCLKKEKLPLVRALAEEYVALVYVNFLITVLLRMRTMVIAAIGMYVFIVLSMNVYPFEPHPALQTLAIVLLVAMGAAIGFVYAQMHRDPILSRLTSTASGELGWDFWLKLASAGAIPVFSLLAVQFPEINRFLFSWLEPALQAVK